MMLYRILAVFVALLMTGCVPRLVVDHDGLETTVIDAETREPLENAVAFNHFGEPFARARSDRDGKILLAPKQRLEFVPFLGEAVVEMGLWVCKEGYVPFQAGIRRGWNADFDAPTTYQPDAIALYRFSLQPTMSCVDHIRKIQYCRTESFASLPPTKDCAEVMERFEKQEQSQTTLVQ